MGMNAYVLCVGKFSEEVKDCLLYDAEFYEDTKPGAAVVAHKFNCSTSEQSKELAKALGCEVWDFNTHLISEDKIDWPDMYSMTEYCEGWEEEHGVAKFIRLLKAGFTCVYMPNG